jgi:hypothetical protein
MGKFDSWELQRTCPEDVTSPGDHDLLVLLDAGAEVMLRDVRRLFSELILSGTRNNLKPLDV